MTYEEHQGWGLDDPTQAMCKRSGQWPVFLSKVLPATWALEIISLSSFKTLPWCLFSHTQKVFCNC